MSRAFSRQRYPKHALRPLFSFVVSSAFLEVHSSGHNTKPAEAQLVRLSLAGAATYMLRTFAVRNINLAQDEHDNKEKRFHTSRDSMVSIYHPKESSPKNAG